VWAAVVLVALALAAVIALAGCGTVKTYGPIVVSAVFDLSTNIVDKAEGEHAGTETGCQDGEGCGQDEVAFDELNWFGSPDQGDSKLVEGVQIGSLSVSDSGLAFEYVSGGCEALGAPSAENYHFTQANVGYKDAGGVWRIAKFDWISTSRRTRSFTNVNDGYNGFDAVAFRAATEYCFVICGVAEKSDRPNGKRSNVLYCKQ